MDNKENRLHLSHGFVKGKAINALYSSRILHEFSLLENIHINMEDTKTLVVPWLPSRDLATCTKHSKALNIDLYIYLFSGYP